jgi:cytosine/adenosine deaminase-related metal-dependent hydrolase
MRQIESRLDTLYSAIEMLESGTTTVHHINSGLAGTPENWDQVTTAILSAYGEIGMRVGYSFMMRDRNIMTYEDDAEVLATMPQDLRAWLVPRLAPALTSTHDYMDFFIAAKRQWETTKPQHVKLHLAPANLHWCSDASLQLIFETARSHGANVHMHLVETERQAAFSLARHGRSAVEHLAVLGCLGPELTLGHGNWMSRRDLDLIGECGCMVCHNASSGLRLGSGIAPLNEMRRRKIPVALGIDQSNLCDDRDMMIEMKLVWALHRETGLWNNRPDAAEVIGMATEHGARSAGFGDLVGRLEPGRQADIVLMSEAEIGRPFVDRSTPFTEAVLHRGGKHAIDKVFVGGRLVVDAGRVVSLDRDAVMREIADRLALPDTPVEIEARATIGRLMPYLESFHRARTPSDGYRSYRYNAMDDREV